MTATTTKHEAAEAVRDAKERKGLTWRQIAEAIDRSPEWTISALLGNHPVPADAAATIGELLDLHADAVRALKRQPYRPGLGDMASDPTIYRFTEAIAVYGAAIKELIHEDFGDGIMSAIDFTVDVSRRPDPKGDRVVVTFDGKFLSYPG